MPTLRTVNMRIARPDHGPQFSCNRGPQIVSGAASRPGSLLVGNIHGRRTGQYYHAERRSKSLLDAQTVVRYEGLNADAHLRHVGKTWSAPRIRRGLRRPVHGTNQKYLDADVLGKQPPGAGFQLNAINYDRTNL